MYWFVLIFWNRSRGWGNLSLHSFIAVRKQYLCSGVHTWVLKKECRTNPHATTVTYAPPLLYTIIHTVRDTMNVSSFNWFITYPMFCVCFVPTYENASLITSKNLWQTFHEVTKTFIYHLAWPSHRWHIRFNRLCFGYYPGGDIIPLARANPPRVFGLGAPVIFCFISFCGCRKEILASIHHKNNDIAIHDSSYIFYSQFWNRPWQCWQYSYKEWAPFAHRWKTRLRYYV